MMKPKTAAQPTSWKSQHDGSGKALWIRLGGARVVSEWAVRDGCG